MFRSSTLSKTAFAVAAAASFGAGPLLADAHTPVIAQATLIGTDGAEIGIASLTQGPAGVLIHLEVEGLTPGAHGLHLHSRGLCEPGEGFTTSEGHVAKTEGGHGLLNPDGPEAGDLPNLFVGADGTGEMEAHATMVSLGSGENDLLDEDGSAFIIHEAADDHMTQPIGGAGGRVACGVVEAG